MFEVYESEINLSLIQAQDQMGDKNLKQKGLG
jgi:hypothetical protein